MPIQSLSVAYDASLLVVGTHRGRLLAYLVLGGAPLKPRDVVLFALPQPAGRPIVRVAVAPREDAARSQVGDSTLQQRTAVPPPCYFYVS